MKFLSIIIVLMLLPLVSASLVYKQGGLVDVRVPCINNGTACSASATCNITVLYSNGTVLDSNKAMTNSGVYHNYSLSYTWILGTYAATTTCDDSGSYGYDVFEFEITENGKENPEGIIVVVFSILFFVIFAWMVYTMFMVIGSLGELSTDFSDVTYAMMGYFGLIVFYYFAQIYFAKKLVLDISLTFIKIGGFTHVILPFICFVLALTLGTLKKQKLE